MQPAGTNFLLGGVAGSNTGGSNQLIDQSQGIALQQPGTVSLPVQPSSNTTSTPPATPGNTGGSGGGTTTSTATPLSQDTINAMLSSIAGAIANNQQAFTNAQTQNAGTDANAEGAYNNQVQDNTTARSTAVQNADQAAASGSQGLRAVLASLGALGGTGSLLAGRAVADSANSDIGSADSTYTTNNEAIQQAHKDYGNQAAARDTALQTALTSDNKSATATGIQNLLNDAQTSGDVATYQKFLPQLVAADVAPTQAIASAPLVYANAPTSSYAPTSSQTVTASQPSAAAASSAVTPVNSALYATKTNN